MTKEPDLTLKDRLKAFEGSACEVTVMGSSLTVPCRLAEVLEQKEEGLSVEIMARRGLELPPVKIGAAVKLALFGSEGMLALGGKVYINNEVFWRITGLTLFNDFERRGFFRVSSDARAKVCLWENDEPMLCGEARLINISISGVLFISQQSYRAGSKLRLSELCLNEDEPEGYTLFCTVRHLGAETRHGIQYRCSFENMDPRDIDRLCRSVFKLQRKMIQKVRNRI